MLTQISIQIVKILQQPISLPFNLFSLSYGLRGPHVENTETQTPCTVFDSNQTSWQNTVFE